MALPPALNREFDRVRMNHAERKKLRSSRGTGPGNSIRRLLGWPEMSASRPTLEEADQDADRA